MSSMGNSSFIMDNPIPALLPDGVGIYFLQCFCNMATTTHNGDDGDDNDKDMTMAVVGGAKVMFVPDAATAAVIILDVHICMMLLPMLLYRL